MTTEQLYDYIRTHFWSVRTKASSRVTFLGFAIACSGFFAASILQNSLLAYMALSFVLLDLLQFIFITCVYEGLARHYDHIIKKLEPQDRPSAEERFITPSYAMAVPLILWALKTSLTLATLLLLLLKI